MVAAGSLAYTGFFSAQVFLNLLIDNAFLLIVAVGMTFVILSGGIDLSVGSVVALTTMVLAWARRARAAGRRLLVIPLVLLGGHAVRRGDGLRDPGASRCRPSSSRWPACSSRAACAT